MGFATDLMKAVDFAAKKHKDQRRKDASATPYINHPVGVATILSQEAGIEDLVLVLKQLLKRLKRISVEKFGTLSMRSRTTNLFQN